MSWLTLNGIETSWLVALGSSPSGEHRDIGAQGDAADGSLVLTRQVRKRDLKFDTVPLSGADAFSWEQFLIGEGHVWSFDEHSYSSKGLRGTLNAGATFDTTTFKYGSRSILLSSGSDSFEVNAPFAPKTIAAWRNDSSTWHHIVWLPDAERYWRNGVEQPDDTPAQDIFLLSGSNVEVVRPDDPTNYDDLIICPYEWLEDWPAQVFAATHAFGPTPYLIAAGDLVPEADTREMACVRCSEQVMKANLNDGEGMASDVRVLSVELKAR